jgi:hypothetical protein
VPRTTEQRDEALALANEVRVAQARMLRGVRAGTVELEDALADPAVGSMQVHRLLRNVPVRKTAVGAYRSEGPWVEKALKAAGCAPWRRVRDLTERQRRVLVEFDRPVKRSRASDG